MMKTVNDSPNVSRPSVVCYNRYRLVHRWVPEMGLNVQSKSSTLGVSKAECESPAVFQYSGCVSIWRVDFLESARGRNLRIANEFLGSHSYYQFGKCHSTGGGSHGAMALGGIFRG